MFTLFLFDRAPEDNSDHEQEREPESPEVVSPPSTTRPSRKRRYVRIRTSSVKEKAKPKTSHCGKSKPNPDLVPVNVVKEGYDVVDEFVPNLPEFKPCLLYTSPSPRDS